MLLKVPLLSLPVVGCVLGDALAFDIAEVPKHS